MLMNNAKDFATQVAVWCMITTHVVVCAAAAWRIVGWAVG
jgi:hypothetical protein